MRKAWRQFWKLARGGIFSIALTATAAAAPPPNRGESPLRITAGRPALSRLDLRAPAELPASATAETNHSLATDGPAFPAVRRTSDDTRTTADSVRAKLEEDLRVRSASRAEELARRFRREGLPVARLFESRSALVSLGLNQRGKPGIWLIQKVP